MARWVVLWTSHNMCMKWKMCVRSRAVSIARENSAAGGSENTAVATHGKDSLEELFISVANEPEQRVAHGFRSFRRTSAIVIRQFYPRKGSPARVLPLFGWVAIDMVTWGFITKYSEFRQRIGIQFLVPSLLGAVLLWDFFSRVMHGVTMTFFEDVWSRNFLNVFATPLSISGIPWGWYCPASRPVRWVWRVMLVLATACFRLVVLCLRSSG